MNIRGALIGVAMAMASSTAGAGLAPFLVNLTNGTGVTPVECFSANDAGNCATANAQLELYAWNAATLAGSSSAFSGFGGLGANQVLWEFRNVGANASSITQVFWENPGLSTLLSIGGFIDADDNFIAGNGDPGVDFSVGTPQPNVPAGNTVSIANGGPFTVTDPLKASPDSPTQPNGVNPGERLGVIMNLAGGLGLMDLAQVLGRHGHPGGGACARIW